MSSSKKVRLNIGESVKSSKPSRRSPQSKNYSDFLEGKEKERRQPFNKINQ